MDRIHRDQQSPIPGVMKPGIDPVPPTTSSGGRGLERGRSGLVLVAVLLVALSQPAHARGAVDRPGGSDAVASQAPPTPPQTVPPPALPSTPPDGTTPASLTGPRIRFATPVYDAGRIRSGEAVKYTYAFTNIGDRVLEVTKVQPSCGCTAAGDWSRKVEPGQTGGIPIQFETRNFGGQVVKSITVSCNDTNQPSVVLQLKALIWKPVEVTPLLAVLNVTSDAPSSSTTVRIVSHEDAPLTLSAPESNNPAFAAELGTNQPGKEFQLMIRTVPPLPVGNARGIITVKTSSTNMPVITVTAMLNVQQPVLVMPSQITLSAPPLTRLSYPISIRANGTNNLALSEPAVNVPGVDVQLKEAQPGRSFQLTVVFPVGIELPQGEQIQVSVKSNHPRFPVINVPIRQLARPALVAEPVPVPQPQPQPQPQRRAPSAVRAPAVPPPIPPGAGS